MQNQEELFDVVDENDNVLRQVPRAIVHRDKLLHRAVHIFVFNSQGQIYIQKRSPNKDQLPNCWTSSCSGHVDAGETYDIAAVRELGEELDVHIDGPDSLEYILKHKACKQTGWEFVHVYQMTWDGPIQFDPEEISEGQWIELDAMESWMKAERHDFAPSFRHLWNAASKQGCFK